MSAAVQIPTTLALGLLALVGAPQPAIAEEMPRILRVTRGSLVTELIETGEVHAISSRDIAAPPEWRMDLQIVRLVPEGTTVAPGDTLVQFDVSALERELNQALAQLEDSQADLQRVVAEQGTRRLQLRNQVDQSKFRAEQAALQIEKLGFESEAKRQEAQLELQKARITQREAEAKLRAQSTLDSLERAKANLKIVKATERVAAERDQIDAMTLIAPTGGLVVHGKADQSGRKLREGDTVHGGQSVALLPDLSRMEVVVKVNEVDRERVFVGQKARVSLDAYPDMDMPGEVIHLARLAMPAKRSSAVRIFEIRVRIDGEDERLKPGMTAKLRLARDRRDDVLRIPRAALFSTADGSSVVFPRDQWPQPRAVHCGLVAARWVEALEGVSKGEELAAVAPAGAGVVAWNDSATPQSAPAGQDPQREAER